MITMQEGDIIMKIFDCGVSVGIMDKGKKDAITDVKGVKVGHSTLIEGESVRTGVTAIIPHPFNVFEKKCVASSHVINGFGKSTGLVQIEELGTLETPIILTNTLSVGMASDALVTYMLNQNKDIGRTTGTVNPVVGECNDGYLNDIRRKSIEAEDVWMAVKSASEDFEEGAVGAGTGMSCYQLKGGIGSASRIFELDGKVYTLGVLVLSNFGELKDLVVDGKKLGKKIIEMKNSNEDLKEQGSIITVIATDVPLSDRQLKRICKRASVGISRTGSYCSSGSGEMAIAFTTANMINHYEKSDIVDLKMINENRINILFRATVEATEEAILNSMIAAETTIGRNKHVRFSLREYIGRLI